MIAFSWVPPKDAPGAVPGILRGLLASHAHLLEALKNCTPKQYDAALGNLEAGINSLVNGPETKMLACDDHGTEVKKVGYFMIGDISRCDLRVINGPRFNSEYDYDAVMRNRRVDRNLLNNSPFTGRFNVPRLGVLNDDACIEFGERVKHLRVTVQLLRVILPEHTRRGYGTQFTELLLGWLTGVGTDVWVSKLTSPAVLAMMQKLTRQGRWQARVVHDDAGTAVAAQIGRNIIVAVALSAAGHAALAPYPLLG